MPTIRALLAECSRANEAEARHEAEILLGHALGQSRAWLFSHADFEPAVAVEEYFRELLAARQRGEPVAYLTGRRGFWTLDLDVTRDVLIPRPETELLVELALQRIPPDGTWRVADLGTGSGAIALALAKERPRAWILATDASVAALQVARENAMRLEIGNVEFALGNWCDALDGARFDLVVSNPPYIAAGDVHLGRGDLRFEPSSALASGADGLDAIRSIVRAVARHLAERGWLLLEHGYDQGERVRAILEGAGFGTVQTWQDMAGHDRVSGGMRT